MGARLEKFAVECRRLLQAEPGAAGRKRVCELLSASLRDEAFVKEVVDDATSERHLAYEDKELGFCIFGHRYEIARSDVPPHDHGPSWAIYGQARGETKMTDYALVEAASPGKPGKVRATRSYAIGPGDAYLYNEGDLHAPLRERPTRLVRIEGMNMDRVERLKYAAV